MLPLEFHVLLDSKTGRLNLPPKVENDDWTKLDFHKCDHCPLDSKKEDYCPAAVGLGHLVDAFRDMKSFWKCRITVTTTERSYVKNADVQSGLFSLFGLIMASSGCPHLDFLRPMARFHLPFSNVMETVVRAISMYLLSQYFKAKRGGQPDITLNQVDKLYKNVNKVNQGILARICEVGKGDSKYNAVVVLDTFAFILKNELSNDLSIVKDIFEQSYKNN